MGGLKMKLQYSLFVIAASIAAAHADERIYRCGNEYTNTVTEAQAKTCKLLSGGNVTVIQAVKPTPPKAGSSGPKNDSPDQRAKEADARLILESELKRAEARQAELLKEYNNGEPERLGPETRNHQKYLERVAALKASIARNESDISGIKRELSRLSPAASSSVSNAK
jgi:type IV secretory pathway VirB4 component